MDPNSPAPATTPATSPPAEPAAPAAPAEPQAQPAPQPNPTGSEPDNNPSGQPPAEPAMVPSDRLREETEKRHKAEEEAAQLREQLENPPAPAASSVEEDELDPDVENLIRMGAKKLGLVSREELDAEKVTQQVQQDVKTLETQYANSGVPYDHQQVVKYANDNNMPIISKAALEAAYRSLNWDKLLEVERQRAIAENHGGGSGAERPGSSGGATPPSEPEVKGRNPRERGISRIRQARQKLPG